MSSSTFACWEWDRDGHVASIFPEHPSSYAEARSFPYELTEAATGAAQSHLPVINRSHEVWFVVSGAIRLRAVKMALLGAGPVQVPAAGVAGAERTLRLLDKTPR
jgi:6-phosphogluconolactonase